MPHATYESNSYLTDLVSPDFELDALKVYLLSDAHNTERIFLPLTLQFLAECLLLTKFKKQSFCYRSVPYGELFL